MKDEIASSIEHHSDETKRIPKLASRIDVPVGWLFYQIKDSDCFKIAEKKSRMKYDHLIEVIDQ